MCPSTMAGLPAIPRRTFLRKPTRCCACCAVLCCACCAVLCAVCCVLCAVCCVLCAVCCVLCAVCCVLCAVCCVLCVCVSVCVCVVAVPLSCAVVLCGCSQSVCALQCLGSFWPSTLTTLWSRSAGELQNFSHTLSAACGMSRLACYLVAGQPQCYLEGQDMLPSRPQCYLEG